MGPRSYTHPDQPQTCILGSCESFSFCFFGYLVDTTTVGPVIAIPAGTVPECPQTCIHSSCEAFRSCSVGRLVEITTVRP